MRLLGNASIRCKLTVITMLTAGLALLLACGAFVFHDAYTFREALVEETVSHAQILGYNSTAAVSFKDESAAAEMLASLRAEPHIIAARVMLPNGSALAEYTRKGTSGREFGGPLEIGHRFRNNNLELACPIEHQGKTIGTIEVYTDLDELHARIGQYLLISGAVLLVAMAVAFGVSFMLQRVLTSPIRHLAAISQKVSTERVFDVRATKWGHDEIGQFTDCFNEMLSQIQERDRQLQAHRDHLEEQVAIRTEELRLSNVQLGTAKERAEESNRLKSEFLANMSHEIRTPMTAIMGYADLLLYPDQTPSDRLQCIQTIRRNGDHLLMIINDILDISKIEAGRMTVEKMRCSPFQIVSEVASLMRVRAIDKDLEFGVQYRGAIPNTIETDPTRLRQVLLNIIANAIKFTEKGSVRLAVSMDERSKSHLRLDVIDTGIGMTEEQQARIFSAFTQADGSMTRRFGGTGLGLAISKSLVQMLGGEITVQSELGKGTTFTITIDVGHLSGVEMSDRSSESCVGTQPETEEGTAPAPASKAISGRLLLAEDGADNQRLIAFLLKRAGAQVDVAENGRIAVEKATEAADRGQPYDLLLMDMQMPEMDGYEATSKLRAKGYDVPIIALTAHAMADDRIKCINAGCSDYLTKPIDRERLLSTIDFYLSRRPGKSAAQPAPSAEQSAPSPEPTQSSPIAVHTPLSAHHGAAKHTLIRSSYSAEPGMREIIDSFIARLPERVGQLVSLSQENNLDELRRAVHQIKGAGGGYGFDSMTKLAATVEASIKNGEKVESIAKGLDELVELIRNVEGYDRDKEHACAAESIGH